MKKKIFILGKGQFGRFVYNLISEIDDFSFSGFIVKNKITNKNLINETDFFKNKKKFNIFPAVGDLKVRSELIKKIIKSKNHIPNIIHPTSYISKSAKYKSIMATYRSFISNNVIIGDYSVIGTGSFIHHDTKIGKNCLIGGGTHIGAGVVVGNNVLFGISSSVASKNIKIGNNAIIASGAAVLNDIPDNCIALGNPARVIKKD